MEALRSNRSNPRLQSGRRPRDIVWERLSKQKTPQASRSSYQVLRQSSDAPSPPDQAIVTRRRRPGPPNLDSQNPDLGNQNPALGNRSRPTSTTNFDTVLNSTNSNSKNVTVHLEFDLSHDLDDELEEFNKFLRRGDFSTAEAYFDQHLNADINNPWVFIQYADMLLKKGDYRSFHQLNSESIFLRLRQSGSDDECDALAMLKLNWALLKAVALTRSQHEIKPICDQGWQLRSVLPASRNMGSTEVSGAKFENLNARG